MHIDENGDGDATYELQVFENSAFRELGYFTPIEKKLVMFDNVKVSTAMLVYTVAMSKKRKYVYIHIVLVLIIFLNQRQETIFLAREI